MESKKREVQREITCMMEKLPPNERQHIELDEQKERRKERQRIKQELWKYREKKEKHKEQTEKHSDKQEYTNKGRK